MAKLTLVSSFASLLGADAAFLGSAPRCGHDASCGVAASAAGLQLPALQLRTSAATMVAAFEISNPGSMTKDERMRSRYGGLAFQPDEFLGEEADFSYDDLASQMNSIPTYTRGDTTTGTVIGFEPNGALVDIGVKSSAYVSVRRPPRLHLFICSPVHTSSCPLALPRTAPCFSFPWESLALASLLFALAIECRPTLARTSTPPPCAPSNVALTAARDGPRQTRQARNGHGARRALRVCDR